MSLSIQKSFELVIVSLLVVGCLSCSNDDCTVCPSPPEVRTDFVSIEQGPYYLSWTHGDSELNGTPYVYFTARAYVTGVDSLMCYVSMTAMETYGETSGLAVVDECVWEAPDGWQITNIDWESCDIWEYMDGGGGWHDVSCTNTSTWGFDYIGDTGGADICSHDDCTQFKFTFMATVEYERL